MSMRTITLKLYKPGKRKRQIMDEAMENYSMAYQYLLDKASTQIENLQENYMDSKGNYTAIGVSKWIDKEMSLELNRFGIEPFKDSLKIDFSTMLAGYLSLRKVQRRVSFPKAYMSPEKWEDRWQDLINRLDCEEKEIKEINREVKRLEKK